jgi:pyruvate-ferredoxin/flavodoxin oxidoreductase
VPRAAEPSSRAKTALPIIVENTMGIFAKLTGRQYRLFDYVGASDAERMIVLMGSGVEAVQETVEYLVARGEKLGAVKVRLYRPFSIERFMRAPPATTKVIASFDRTKRPGSLGEPLYLDVVTALQEHNSACKPSSGGAPTPRVIGGRYGLSSKEFTPAMIKSVFNEMAHPTPRNHLTIGIRDDATRTSLDYDPAFSTENPGTVRAIFYGLGADGTERSASERSESSKFSPSAQGAAARQGIVLLLQLQLLVRPFVRRVTL